MFEPNIWLCRLCRQSSGPYVDIFNPKGTKGLIVWKVIKDLIQIDVSKDDMLPNAICIECMRKVVDFRNFKTMCINSRIEFLKDSASIGLVEVEADDCQMEVEARAPMTVPGTVDSTCADGGLWVEEDPLDENPREHDMYAPSEREIVFHDPRSGGSECSIFCIPGNISSSANSPSQALEPMSIAMESSLDVKAVSSSMHDDNGVVSIQSIEQNSPSIPCEGEEEIPSQYLERRLDESIGSLKSCDAPNCRKVFSSYKALVIHKRAKHPELCVSEEVRKDDFADGSPTKRPSYSQGGGPNDSVSHGSEEAAMHIAEFECSYPNCGMKFTNLSFLLNHQTTHPQPRDVDGTDQTAGEVTENSEVLRAESWSSEIVVLDAESMDKGSRISEDFGDPSGQHAVDVSGDEGPVGSLPTSGHPDKACLPEEPEFLCHAADCGRAFFSYSRLVRHRKVKHSKRKRKSATRIVPKEVKVDEGEMEKKKSPLILHCSACGMKHDTVQALVVHKSYCVHGSGSKEGEGQERKNNPQPDLRCATCGFQLTSLRSLQLHQRHCVVRSKQNKGRKLRDRVGVAGSSKNGSRTKKTRKRRKESVVKVTRVKAESSEEGSSPENNVGDEAFECQFRHCPEVFTSFKGLLLHVTQAHGYEAA